MNKLVGRMTYLTVINNRTGLSSETNDPVTSSIHGVEGETRLIIEKVTERGGKALRLVCE